VGSIGTGSNELIIGTGNTALRFWDYGNALLPRTTANGVSNGVITLGEGSNKFKDAYLSGTVNAGGLITTGNVGIGVTAPTIRIDSRGNGRTIQIGRNPITNYYGSSMYLSVDVGSTERAWNVGTRYKTTNKGDLVFEYSTNDMGREGDAKALTYSERMRINSDGIVTKPYQPIISGQMNTAQTDPVAPILLSFDEFWTNSGITFNATTKRFTVPTSGTYRITLNPFFKTGTGSGRVMVGVNTDSPSVLTHRGHTYKGSSNYETGCINSVVYLSANDYVVFYLALGGLYNQTSDRFNQFSIELIG